MEGSLLEQWSCRHTVHANDPSLYFRRFPRNVVSCHWVRTFYYRVLHLPHRWERRGVSNGCHGAWGDSSLDVCRLANGMVW